MSSRPQAGRSILRSGVNPCSLRQAGWGIIAHRDEDPKVLDALQPLLRLRKKQAGRLFVNLSGENGYTGETKRDFLQRLRIGDDLVTPARLPYYLLLVGNPELIPFDFQHQLDVQYAVGRL